MGLLRTSLYHLLFARLFADRMTEFPIFMVIKTLLVTLLFVSLISLSLQNETRNKKTEDRITSFRPRAMPTVEMPEEVVVVRHPLLHLPTRQRGHRLRTQDGMRMTGGPPENLGPTHPSDLERTLDRECEQPSPISKWT